MPSPFLLFNSVTGCWLFFSSVATYHLLPLTHGCVFQFWISIFKMVNCNFKVVNLHSFHGFAINHKVSLVISIHGSSLYSYLASLYTQFLFTMSFLIYTNSLHYAQFYSFMLLQLSLLPMFFFFTVPSVIINYQLTVSYINS